MFPLFAVLGHVPTYGSACTQPPHHHTTSQAVYVRGSGGLEIHIKSDSDPFDIAGNELIDVDAVFKKKYPFNWYNLYIGCGGCVDGVDPIVIAPANLTAYEEPVVEAFTQTLYRSVFPKGQRKFNTSHLNSSICKEKHFTIRLQQTELATETVVWSAVVGLGERFSAEELVSFPLYVLRNHGDAWNELAWTWVATLLVFAPLLIAVGRSSQKALGFEVLELITIRKGKLHVFFDSYREPLYEIGIWTFTATGLEMFIHACVAVQGVSDAGGFIAAVFIAWIPNGLGILFCVNNWTAIRYRGMIDDWPPPRRFKMLQNCSRGWWRTSANPWWAPIEIATGVSFLFLFGAGFFAGPAAVILAGIVRLRELRHSNRVQRVTTGFKPPEKEPILDPRGDIKRLPKIFLKNDGM